MMLVRFALSLRQRGHNAFVFTPPASPIEQACREHAIHHIPLTVRLRYLDPIAFTLLSTHFRKHSIDIVLIGLSRDVSMCVLAKKLSGRGKLVFFQQMQFGLKKKDLFHRWAYGNLALWICLTQRMKDAVIQKTIVPREKIKVIPFGVDLKSFDPSLYSKEESRDRFGIPKDKIVVAVVGRFDKQKGQEYLLRATPDILKSHPNVHVLLVGEETMGEPGYKQFLKNLADSLRIRESVQFLPFTTEVPKLLAGIDLLVLPSLSETFGYVALEAMAMGKPVIGTNAGGVPEIIEDGQTGFLVNVADPNDLAAKITKLLTNDNVRSAMSVTARKRVVDRFNFEANILQLEAMLQEVAG